ncbi:hypothetical protein IEO21_06576 [Rhodonia placenta]|uniref:DUF6533 domain-containing protein n=1 Tax=Rhodonia placenta TaxID=104341 RepID=A0A8H7U0K9_9APHY|nr:hypothetical protein IEO21_06576 [Postia placenta]
MSTEDFYVEASEETLQLNYCALASVVLVFYEHSLTLADEMQLVWASKVTGPKVLFVAARYTLWVICLVQIWLILPQSNPTSCQVENILSMITDLSQYVVMLVFSALRAYAISGQHKAPAIIIAIILTFSVSINLYQYSTSVYATVLNVGIESVCNWGFTVLPNIGLILLTLVTVINMAMTTSPSLGSVFRCLDCVSQDITYFQATRRIWHVNSDTGSRTFDFRLP